MRVEDQAVVQTTSAGGQTGLIDLRSAQQRWLPVPNNVVTNGRPAESTAQIVPTSNSEFEQFAAALRERRPTRYERLIKPLIDRAISALLVLLLSPVMAAIYVAVLIAVGRPAIFRQVRVGRNGRTFSMLKFRTMKPDRRSGTEPYIGPERRVTHKSANDPRHTRLGRWMRKTSLDELPQLIHVMRGQMSLVGPRPELAELIERYAPWQLSRHLVKPGVTGLWQTTERGEGRLLHECIELDLQYISRLSFRRDVAILARTPLALLRNKGVI